MAYQTVTPNQLGQGAIGVGVSTLYTAAAVTRVFLKDMDICNTTAAAILVSIFLVPAAGVAGTGNALMYTQTVPALSTVQWSGNQILLPGGTIQVQASAVGLTITASGGEAT